MKMEYTNSGYIGVNSGGKVCLWENIHIQE